jgi:penicillin-binding protein 2
VPEKASPKVLGSVQAPAEAFAFIQQSMNGTVIGNGTAAKAFAGFPNDRVFVSGKSGTAQMAPKQDFSWFAAIARQGGKQLAVAALVEEGGTGSQVAAPIVRSVIERYFGLPEGNFEAGVRAD